MWRPERLWAALALSLAVLVSWPAAASEQAELEARLEQLRADMVTIQARLDDNLATRDALRLELAQAERRVAEASRARLATQHSLAETSERIDALEIRVAAVSAEIEQLAEALGAQLRLAHQQGGQSRLKLLLNQDDPRILARQMAYHGYLSRARLSLLSELRTRQQELARHRTELGHEQQQLSALEGLQAQALAELQSARTDRDAAIERLQSDIESQTSRLARMEQDAAELQQLIEELARALDDIPMDLEVPSVLSLQGQLPLPAAGTLKRRFGDSRGAELRWNGWLIGAEAGSGVSAVAHGRVVFADWLRGYGMLMIIDHGDGVMSLYGHNESLLRRVGDWVAPGDRIAIVGESGGGEAGLYFELRRDGRPLNPSTWLTRP